MKRLIQFVLVFFLVQRLIAESNHVEMISPELNLNAEQSQLDPDASTKLKSSSEDIKLPYGITIDKHSQENEDLSHNEKYTITQKDKIVDVIEGYYIYDIYDGDIDKDGVRDLIFKTYSGGAHCCFDLYIAQITKGMKKPIRIPLNNLDTIEFKDHDGDGIQEWIMYDDRYSYFLTCFACSPAVQLVATYKKGKLILRPKLTKIHTAERLEKLTSSHVMLDGRGYLHISEEYAPAVINSFLYHFYSGDKAEAVRVIDKYLTFEGRGVKLLFLKALIQSMSESYFWDQLRKLNHLYDGGVDTGYPIALYDVESIAMKLFEELESMKSIKVSNEWIDPSKQKCQENGGEYDAKQGICENYAENAKKICQNAGGRIPTLDDFELLVKQCGSQLNYFEGSKEMIEEVKKNKLNQMYQACYKELGFKRGYGYWTSTTHSVNAPSLIYVHLEEGTYGWYDGWRKKIRCIKE